MNRCRRCFFIWKWTIDIYVGLLCRSITSCWLTKHISQLTLKFRPLILVRASESFAISFNFSLASFTRMRFFCIILIRASTIPVWRWVGFLILSLLFCKGLLFLLPGVLSLFLPSTLFNLKILQWEKLKFGAVAYPQLWRIILLPMHFKIVNPNYKLQGLLLPLSSYVSIKITRACLMVFKPL